MYMYCCQGYRNIRSRQDRLSRVATSSLIQRTFCINSKQWIVGNYDPHCTVPAANNKQFSAGCFALPGGEGTFPEIETIKLNSNFPAFRIPPRGADA